MKSLIAFFQIVLADAGTRCGISTTHDAKSVLGRVEREGDGFLTITLANFGKGFERSLDQGFVSRDSFPGFRYRAGLPELFRGFLGLVFDTKTGQLNDVPNIDAIRCVRQLTLMFAKIERPCSKERERKAIDGYFETERSVYSYDQTFTKPTMFGESRADKLHRVGMLLWAELFSTVDQQIYNGELIPKHGPGATADRKIGNAKWEFDKWPLRFGGVFPDWDFLIPNTKGHFLRDLEEILSVDPGSELPAKVTLVPKTQKTPRIIAMEPSYMMYVQQAILEKFVDATERIDIPFQFIRSKSQIPNNEAAKRGSRYGDLATLDLSEASDRVSYLHVMALLRNFPHLREAVSACRSTKADVFGKVISLSKFASMGSALCFPFESIVFTTLVFLGIEKALQRPLTKKDVQSFFSQVRVYGDDIIVPVEYVPFVIGELEAYGFKVNRHKSFWNGKFRESCGADYYDGHDVSIVKVRSDFPVTKRSIDELISTVSLRNLLFEAGGWDGTVSALDSFISRLIRFPTVDRKSPMLGRWTHGPCQIDGFSGGDAENPSSKWKDTHIPLVRGYVPVSRLPSNSVDGVGALMKFFLKRGEEPFLDRRHLDRSGRPSVSIKLGWVPAIPY